MKQNRNMLGIVFYEQAIAVAEVESGAGSDRVRRTAQFQLPDGVTLENIASIQTQFGAFLKEHGFKTRKAAVGISAKQMLPTLLKVPPIEDLQTRRETIQIHLERKLRMELPDVAFDYWKNQDKNSQTTLAMTTLKTTIASIRSLLSGLKITPVLMTGTSLGIDFETSDGIDCNMVEYPKSVEMFLFENGDLKAVQMIPKEPSGLFDLQLAAAIVRQVSRIQWSVSIKSGTELNYICWTGNPQTTDSLKTVFGRFKRMDITAAGRTEEGGLCDYAVQLADRMLSADAPSINFLDGHQQHKKRTMSRQRLTRIMLFVAAGVLLVGIYLYGWYADRAAIVQYRRQLDSMKENVLSAEQTIEQVGRVRPWFMDQPVHLERLRELTLAFPQSSTIWLTSLAVDESLNQIITGRAVSEQAILDVVDTLKSNPLFGDIKLLYIRKMGKETNVMTFAINFHARGEQ
jgi:Tfp pilus assembly protein PilN